MNSNKEVVLTPAEENHLKRFNAKKPVYLLDTKENKPQPFVIFDCNWKAWQAFKDINDQFRWQRLETKKGIALIRTGLDASAVINYLQLIGYKNPKKQFKKIKTISRGVISADRALI